MVKQESSTPGVYLVGPSGGKMRPWCGHCHKFLKSETAPHDCNPVNLSSARSAKGASKGAKRRIRLTDKNKALLSKVFEAAAFGEDAVRVMKKLSAYSKRKNVSGKRLARLIKDSGSLSKTGTKRAASLKKRFL